jgi:hypothetical protein
VIAEGGGFERRIQSAAQHRTRKLYGCGEAVTVDPQTKLFKTVTLAESIYFHLDKMFITEIVI